MEVKAQDIKEKLFQIYPEIEDYGLSLSLNFDEQQKAWLAKFSKGAHELSTHLEEQDVESCLQGRECYHLGIQLGQFIRNYCAGGENCRL
ncbi:MAG: hypothetical protein ACOC43_12130 [Desulfohalobiaceae bacterium]